MLWIFAFIGLLASIRVASDLLEQYGPDAVAAWIANARPWRSPTEIGPIQVDPLLIKYQEGVQPTFAILGVEVATEEDKQQLLLASHHVHDAWDIDTDCVAVNHLVHLYHQPNLIKVRGKKAPKAA